MASGKDPEIGIGLNVDGFVSNAEKARKSGEKLSNLDLSTLSNKIKSLGTGMGNVAGKMAGLVKNLAIGAGVAAAAGIAGAGVLITKGINDAMEDNKIEARMKQVFAPEKFEFLNETSDKIKSAFGFDDGDTRKAMTMLGEMGMTAEQSAASMSLAADVARAKNMSIGDSARLVGKAFQGNEMAAKRLGIVIQKTGDPIKDQAALMDALQAKFGGAAAAYSKNLPPLEKAKVAISDMVKAVGAKLIPIVVPFLQWVSNTLTGIADSEGFGNFVSGLVGGFKMAWNFAKQVGITLMTYGIAFFDIIKQLPAALGKMWDSGKLMDLFVSLIGGLLKTAWDALVALGKLIWTGIMDGIPALVGFLGKTLIDLLRSVLGEFVSNKLGLGTASDAMNDMMKDSGAQMAENSKKAFSEFGTKAKENFADMGAITNDAFKENGLDMGGSVDKARKQVGGMFGLGDQVKQKMAQDTKDVYGLTGKASQTIGMSQTAAKNAQLKNKKKLKKSASKDNKKAMGGMNLNINLQSSERLNPIMATT